MKTWKKCIALIGLFGVLGMACDPGLGELSSDVQTLDVVLTPTANSRRFIFSLETRRAKDVEWELQKFLASIKYTFGTRDHDNPDSAHVEVSIAAHPDGSNAQTNCFDSPKSCDWQTKNIDLQKNYEWHLGRDVELSTNQQLFIHIKLKEGAPVKGKLAIDCKLKIAGASPEDIEGTQLNWRVSEYIVE